MNDLKHGKGTVYFDNGKKIEGNWKNGIRDGEFKLYKNKDVNEFKVEVFQNGVKKATK
jgi:antitoxin component YwqK of YwqJK toxin-antitoxin module